MPKHLALIGCGGMGLRHALGYIELREHYESFQLVAICDRHEQAANHVADVVERATGHRPKIYLDYSQMFESESLDAIDITTDTRMHHTLAISAFEHGVHVLTEKPMGITLAACRAMESAANDAGCVLSIGEQYRRDPMNRLTRALLTTGSIGTPTFAVKFSVGGGSDLMHGTGWRALKSRAGSVILEQGVHESDLLQYFMGDVETVYAKTGIFAKIRTMAGINPNLAQFYSHRVEDQFAHGDQVEIDQEDSAFGVIGFASGAVGQFTITNASHGYSAGVNTVHGTTGTIVLPPSRSGTPPKVLLEGRDDHLSGDEMLEIVPDWQLDDVTAAFWNGETRMASYDMPFESSDRKLVAVELKELADSIDGKVTPEVGPEVGMNGLALPYAMLESGLSGEVVNMADVLNGEVNAYQCEIDAEIFG
jgi:predicted dehydrogenase